MNVRTLSLFAALVIAGSIAPVAPLHGFEGNRAEWALRQARETRRGGCAGHAGTPAALRRDAALSDAAFYWSQGQSLHAALARAGYRDRASTAVSVATASLAAALTGRLCASLTDAADTDLGIAPVGDQLWLIVAAPMNLPRVSGSQLAEQSLARVNLARASARQCGTRWLPAAPPVRLDERLSAAAQQHATDMLTRGYFDHVGADGTSPAQRASAAGYAHRLVGENIASGSATVDETVDGWLDSAAHCENIMDPRFQDMGLAMASAPDGAARIFWVQLLAAPLHATRPDNADGTLNTSRK